MTSRIRLLVLSVILAGCAESPRPTGPLEPDAPLYAGGPANGFPVVTVRADAPAQAQGALVNNLADAVARVAPGGTITVQAGTYAAEDVLIERPVTIEAQSSATRPIVRSSGDAAFLIDGVAAGTVLIRGLRFEVGGRGGVSAMGTYDQVRVEDCVFQLAAESTAGVFGGPSNVAAATLAVLNSSFRGGAIGVFAARAPLVDVRDSHFADHSFSGIQYQDGSAGRIQGNTAERCGPNGCIRVHAPRGVEIVGNQVRNEMAREVAFGIRAFAGGTIRIAENEVVGLGGDAFGVGIEVRGTAAKVLGNRVGGATQGIQFWRVPVGEIARNVVEPCGAISCINIREGGGNLLVTANTLRSVPGRKTPGAILTDWPAGSGSLVITDNDIAGVGAPSNPNDPRTYPIRFAFQNIGWGAFGTEGVARGEPVEFSRNRISNAELGVRAERGGVVVGRDNTFITVYNVLSATDRGINRLRFNDVDGYVVSLRIAGSPVADAPHVGTLEVTCNYWGGGPPQDTGTIPASAYTPWATSPIANTGASSCDGGT